MADIEAHQQYLQNAVLDLLCWGAAIDRMFNKNEILHYLQISANPLPLEKSLKSLLSNKKIIQVNNFYGISKKQYSNPNSGLACSRELVNKARRASWLFRLIPTIKATVLIDDVSFRVATTKSNIDLLIITKPARIYLTKFMLSNLLKFFRLLENSPISSAKFNPKVFITTVGLNFDKDFTKTERPHNNYRLVMAVPIFGDDLWYTILQQQTSLADIFPNIVWSKIAYKVYGKGVNFLDKLDEVGYKRFLKSISTRAQTKTDKAFVRVRPDIINVNLADPSPKITQTYQKYCKRFGLDTKKQNS